MADLQYCEHRVLENCRWLFNQDVRIIVLRNYALNFSSAFVLPKSCSVKSIIESEHPVNALIQTHGQGNAGADVVRQLLAVSESKLFDFIIHLPSSGQVLRQTLELPAGYYCEPPDDENNHGQPDPEDIWTPSVSAMSDTTTTPTREAGFEDLAELNRKSIRREIDLALKDVFTPPDPHTPQVPRVELEGLARLNQRIIREEVDLALKEIFAPPDPHAPTDPKVEYKGLAGLHRRAIKKEIDLALRQVFGGL